jgi:hypothetical protein
VSLFFVPSSCFCIFVSYVHVFSVFVLLFCLLSSRLFCVFVSLCLCVLFPLCFMFLVCLDLVGVP